jgi:NADP-dependent 3-hydroxy acid dehydrogenase YdfG
VGGVLGQQPADRGPAGGGNVIGHAPLAGRVALITGASAGIGAAVARALADAGASIALVARRPERLEAITAQLQDRGTPALALTVDVTREAEIAAAMEAVDARFGRLDILVNNAGVMFLAPIAEADPAEWRQMMELNLWGLMVATQRALPVMKRGAGGHVVNIASVAGRVANPGASGYAATKFGVVAFSESLRREVYRDNIRVTVVEPGLVATELGARITHPPSRASVQQRLTESTPLQPEDVAAAVVYAVTQPPHVNVNEILLRPTSQER